MSQQTKDLERLIREVRAAFNRLRALGDALHADVGVTASMRAVMESLAEHGPRTVPQMARAKSVSRQHIQVNVDALVEARLAAPVTNPKHKRSVLIDLTAAGRRTFTAMRQREAAAMQTLAARLKDADIAGSAAALQALNAELASTLSQGVDHAR